jgi:RHS repeat-associated protein
MVMPGRNYNNGTTKDYRYGFNGKENDNEVKGEGNQQDYGMRIYDPRLGRFLSEDPITEEYPELTPYQFASNTPIWSIDIDGMEASQQSDPSKNATQLTNSEDARTVAGVNIAIEKIIEKNRNGKQPYGLSLKGDVNNAKFTAEITEATSNYLKRNNIKVNEAAQKEILDAALNYYQNFGIVGMGVGGYQKMEDLKSHLDAAGDLQTKIITANLYTAKAADQMGFMEIAGKSAMFVATLGATPASAALQYSGVKSLMALKSTTQLKIVQAGLGVVKSRINLAKGRTRFTPLRKSGHPVSAGWDHVVRGHFNRSVSKHTSVFTVSQQELKAILQSKSTVTSPVIPIVGGQFVRTINVGKTVGKANLSQGGGNTSWLQVFTDKMGNLITTYPVKR